MILMSHGKKALSEIDKKSCVSIEMIEWPISDDFEGSSLCEILMSAKKSERVSKDVTSINRFYLLPLPHCHGYKKTLLLSLFFRITHKDNLNFFGEDFISLAKNPQTPRHLRFADVLRLQFQLNEKSPQITSSDPLTFSNGKCWTRACGRCSGEILNFSIQQSSPMLSA